MKNVTKFQLSTAEQIFLVQSMTLTKKYELIRALLANVKTKVIAEHTRKEILVGVAQLLFAEGGSDRYEFSKMNEEDIVEKMKELIKE